MYAEYKYRSTYIYMLMLVVSINIFIFWNEILVFLLNPLESIILKNNNLIIHKILNEHYIIEDIGSDSSIDLNSDIINNNELPYFEINISNFESIDNVFFIIYFLFFIGIVSPYIIYQIMLFLNPILKETEYKYLKYSFIKYSLLLFISYTIIYNISIPIILRNILVATEEISYYEFEMELTIERYLWQIVKIIIIQSTILLYTITNNKNLSNITILFIILIIIFSVSNIIELFYYIIIFALCYYIKKVIFYIILLKYNYCFSLYRNTYY